MDDVVDRIAHGLQVTEVFVVDAEADGAFTELLLDSMARRRDVPGPFEVAPLDVPDRRWTFGEPDDDVAIVTGPAGDIGWWLTGRPAPDTVTCSRGELPSIEGW